MNKQTVESVRPGIWHIHLDTKSKSGTDAKSVLLHERFRNALGFYAHDFSGHPEGYQHFEPSAHSTIKLYRREAYESMWVRCVNMVDCCATEDDMGYLEGEFIPIDKAIPYKPMVKFFEPGFKIVRRKLSSGEAFREDEFHLVLDSLNSDQRVIKALMEAGLYGANLQKDRWTALVLTIQGTSRLILPLLDEVAHYLSAVGGVEKCTIKREVARNHHLFGGYKIEDLPEVIATVTYR